MIASAAELDEDALLGALVELVDVAEFGLPPSAALDVAAEFAVLLALVLVEEGRGAWGAGDAFFSRTRPAAHI